MSKKDKKICRTRHYIKRFLILASAVNGCVLISLLTKEVGILIGITNSAIGFMI